MRNAASQFLILVSLLSVAPAASVPGQDAAPTRRDSGGVQIVSYTGDVRPTRFTLKPHEVEIGTTRGSELVRVIGAVRMPNGYIVVADARRRQILRFAPNGSLERVLAREGGGPGEFINLRSMHRFGSDSLVAHDGRQTRLAVFSDSMFGRQVLLHKVDHLFLAQTSFLGMLTDGRALVTAGGAFELGDPGPARVEREDFPLVAYERDGRAGRLLGRFPGREIGVSVIKTGPIAGGFQRSPLLFGSTTTFALVRDNVIVVDNLASGFDVLDPTGRLIRRVRLAKDLERVQRSHMSAYADERVRSARQATRSEFENAQHAAVFPALDERVVVDASQRIWLGSYKRPGDRAQDWWLLDVNGSLLGHVTVPSSFTVMDAGADYVLGVSKDDDGVETVRLHRLAPASGRG